MATLSCLVTGGSGFLGINLVRMLLSRGMRVRPLDIAPFAGRGLQAAVLRRRGAAQAD